MLKPRTTRILQQQHKCQSKAKNIHIDHGIACLLFGKTGAYLIFYQVILMWWEIRLKTNNLWYLKFAVLSDWKSPCKCYHNNDVTITYHNSQTNVFLIPLFILTKMSSKYQMMQVLKRKSKMNSFQVLPEIKNKTISWNIFTANLVISIVVVCKRLLIWLIPADAF